jgi:hypothetical protein
MAIFANVDENTKTQTPKKLQAQNTSAGVRNLEVVWSLFGVWFLVFGD